MREKVASNWYTGYVTSDWDTARGSSFPRSCSFMNRSASGNPTDRIAGISPVLERENRFIVNLGYGNEAVKLDIAKDCADSIRQRAGMPLSLVYADGPSEGEKCVDLVKQVPVTLYSRSFPSKVIFASRYSSNGVPSAILIPDNFFSAIFGG